MTLVDAGPLVALIDAGDDDHNACVDALARITEPLLTTLPVVTEAMHLLGRRVGWVAQERLWTLILRQKPELVNLDDAMLARASELMSKYRDLPMDLADASLVALAESKDVRKVWTLDSDFEVYRFRGRQPFELVR